MASATASTIPSSGLWNALATVVLPRMSCDAADFNSVAVVTSRNTSVEEKVRFWICRCRQEIYERRASVGSEGVSTCNRLTWQSNSRFRSRPIATWPVCMKNGGVLKTCWTHARKSLPLMLTATRIVSSGGGRTTLSRVKSRLRRTPQGVL